MRHLLRPDMCSAAFKRKICRGELNALRIASDFLLSSKLFLHCFRHNSSKYWYLLAWLCVECHIILPYLVSYGHSSHVRSFRFPAERSPPVAMAFRWMSGRFRSWPSDRPPCSHWTELCFGHGRDGNAKASSSGRPRSSLRQPQTERPRSQETFLKN